MPLEYNQPAPDFSARLLSSEEFKLSEERGKIVVLYFYTTSSFICVDAIPAFSQLVDEFDKDKLMVVGINLDANLDSCRDFVEGNELNHPQIYDGPWQSSELKELYRISGMPSSFIIDAEGTLAQKDLFGDVLNGFVKRLLLE